MLAQRFRLHFKKQNNKTIQFLTTFDKRFKIIDLGLPTSDFKNYEPKYF